MNRPPHKVEQFVKGLSHVLATPLDISEGICALSVDDTRTMAIEYTEGSDSVLFYAEINTHDLFDNDEAQTYRTLLEFNFKFDLTRGAWFALDKDGSLLLCYLIDIDISTDKSFSTSVLNLIELSEDVQQAIDSLHTTHKSHSARKRPQTIM